MIGAGFVLSLIRTTGGVTRAELVRQTGWSRSTVAQRLDSLVEHRLVREIHPGTSAGGRPAGLLTFNGGAGVVLAADLGVGRARLVVFDLARTPLVGTEVDIDVADGPEPVLEHVNECFTRLLATVSYSPADVRGVGVGLPGPVAFPSGEAVDSPLMPGWDGFSASAWFAGRYRAPVLVDNEVSVMALGEHRVHWRDVDHLVFVRVGTGIACGIVADGQIHRGARYSAGDIGHIGLIAHRDVICQCGNFGCLEAVAGARALAPHLRAYRVGRESSRCRVPEGGAGMSGRLGRYARPGDVSGTYWPDASTSSTRAQS